MILNTFFTRATGISLALYALLFPAAASATVIQMDDAVFGTDAIIRDVDNNRDFLRLDFTVPYAGYNDVLSELGAGGDFDGWLVATRTDMDALGLSADIVHGSTDAAMIARAEQLRDWFCFTCVNPTSTHIVARGLIADTFDYVPNPGIEQVAFSIGRRLNSTPNEVDFRPSGWAGGDWANENIYLVRNSVSNIPEPATLALLALGLILIGLRQRRIA